ncbi:MAG TPA: rod shape-determining protein MreC [Dissulfurispiraceae bacterium]|nr:rod shape-determining protein MreC [Dissulfurispiraceae bacterium]
MPFAPRTKKRLLILAALLVFAFLLVPFYHDKENMPVFMRPFSYAYDSLSNIISSMSAGMNSIVNAKEENKRLKAELQATLVQRERYGEIIKENQRLTDILNLKRAVQGGGIAARVIARGYDKFINTLVIDKGRKQGVVKDMAAITSKGLTGKIYAVRDNYADLILLTDPNFSVAVRLQESRYEGILTGTGHRYCNMKYVATESQVKEGDVVVTSGMDGIFPQGLPVGRVSRAQSDGVEFFQYIEVMPFQPPTKIEEVLLIGRSAEMSKQSETVNQPFAGTKAD